MLRCFEFLPRKDNPVKKQEWRRGDLLARGSETGIVAADMTDRDEFLVVHWRGGVEKIPRSKLGEIRRFTEAEESVARSSGHSPLEDLQTLESMDGVHAMSVERSRTIKSPRERRMVDDLVRRGFAKDFECEWDRKNADMLCLLALQPELVGWRFRFRERLHRPLHTLFHRR